jgi:hypothetical protein
MVFLNTTCNFWMMSRMHSKHYGDQYAICFSDQDNRWPSYDVSERHGSPGFEYGSTGAVTCS